MNTRRFRNHSPSLTLDQFRWLGWTVLMMFVLVQTARGSEAPGGRAEGVAMSHPLAQASAEFNPTTHQVTVKAYASPAAWDFTGELGPRSFVVYEDAIRQPIEHVELVHTPLSIGVLLEDGGRYHALNEALAENVSRAVQELKGALSPDDHVQMWTYSDKVEPVAPADTTAQGLQPAYLRLPTPPSSESNFYDAMLATLPRVQQMPGRKALIVVSSGIDSFSQAGFADVLQAVGEAGVPVCAINIGPLVRSQLRFEASDERGPYYSNLKWDKASAQLARLAKVSACQALTPQSSLELTGLSDRLLTNLRLQYVIHYRSTALDLPGTREVSIAWVDDSQQAPRVAQSATHQRRGREFAQAHYQLDAADAWATSATLKWPFAVFAPTREIQIPLKDPVESNTPQPSASPLAAARDPARGCDGAPCLASDY